LRTDFESIQKCLLIILQYKELIKNSDQFEID